MSSVAKLYQDYDPFHALAGLLSSLRTAYLYSTRLLGKVFVLAAAGLILIPFLRISINLFIYFRARKMRDSIAAFSFNNTDKDTYLSYRRLFDRIGRDIELLEKTQEIDLNTVPWILRGLVKDIRKMVSYLISWRTTFASKLSELQSTQEAAIFQFIPEDELWKSRTKAYAYRL